MGDSEPEIDRGALLDFLRGKIEEEFDLARTIRPSPTREACFHRIAAYCDVLGVLDPDKAQAIRSRAIEEH